MRDRALFDQIGAGLAGLEVDTSKVKVEVRKAKVTLTGTVGSWIETDEIVRAVWAVPGVKEVDNRLIYTEGGATAEVENIP